MMIFYTVIRVVIQRPTRYLLNRCIDVPRPCCAHVHASRGDDRSRERERERRLAGASRFGRRPISRIEIFLREGPGATFVTGRRSTSVASRIGEIRSVLIAPSRCSALIILDVARKTHTYTCARAHHTYTHAHTFYLRCATVLRTSTARPAATSNNITFQLKSHTYCEF